MTMAIGVIMGNTKIIAVDTAISTIINGKRYRTDLSNDKCFIKDNSLIFCSGRIEIARKVSDYIKQMKKVDVKEISEFAESAYNDYLLKYPTKTDIKLWIWVVDKNHFWEFGTDSFEPEDTQTKENTQIKYTGYFEEKGELIEDKNEINKTLNIFFERCMQNKQGLIIFCANIMRHYKCDAVGGYSKIFYYDNISNTFKHYEDIKVDNKHIYTIDELKMITNSDVELESYATVKISKGSFNINSNFIVDQLGNVTMQGTLNIADKLKVDSNGNMILDGGNISWISHDPAIDYVQKTANNALYSAENAQSAANSAYAIANLAGTNISKLADGTYTGGGFIDGKRIEFPEIYGGKISGIDILGSYFRGNTVNSAYITLGASEGGNYGDLQLYRGDGELAFSIYDNLTRVDLKSLGTTFLASSGDKTYPEGTWNFNGTDEVDFTGTNVKGIVARFA